MLICHCVLPGQSYHGWCEGRGAPTEDEAMTLRLTEEQSERWGRDSEFRSAMRIKAAKEGKASPSGERWNRIDIMAHDGIVLDSFEVEMW